MSEMFLLRKFITEVSTIGELYYQGALVANILEPPMKPNAQGLAAIPAGFYEVTPYDSPRFIKIVPLLNNVPGHSFIEMHTGNSVKDTHDCLIVGTYRPNTPDFVFDSQLTYDEVFMPKVKSAWDLGRLFLTIINA